MTDERSEDIRAEVSKAYTRAIEAPAGGCCGGGLHKGAAGPSAGYTPVQIEGLPSEAVDNAFGCGNPVGLSGLRPGETVLDLGSGAGLDLLLASDRVGPTGKVIGVDMTDAMIARARENVARAGRRNVEIRKGLIEALPVETASVDWVISNCVINLSPEKDRVFAEIARVLKPGGRMLISDMVAERLPWWVRRSMTLYASCVAGAVGEAAYLEGLRRAGLTEVEVRGRLVYDRAQLRGMLGSGEMESFPKGLTRLLRLFLPFIAGKVQSVSVFARKPERS